jgi:flagellar protein FlgJ
MSALVDSPAINGYAIDQARADRLRQDTGGKSKQDAKKTAQDFESFFLTQVFEFMSKGVKTDGPTGGGSAEGTWRSFLNDQYGREMSKSHGVGIADMVYGQMLKLQEAQS